MVIAPNPTIPCNFLSCLCTEQIYIEQVSLAKKKKNVSLKQEDDNGYVRAIPRIYGDFMFLCSVLHALYLH